MKGKEVKDKRREKEYSYDLRKKVMDFIIKEGKSQRATSRIFKISMYAINQWYQRYKKEGDYKAKKEGFKDINSAINFFFKYIVI